MVSSIVHLRWREATFSRIAVRLIAVVFPLWHDGLFSVRDTAVHFVVVVVVVVVVRC